MGSPESKSKIEPGIGDIPEKGIFGISPTIDGDLLEVDWVPPKGRGISGRKFFVGLGATGGLLALTGCVPSPILPTETPIVTETTGIPPPPTLKITPTPTEAPTVTPIPEPTKTPTPEPIPTVTVEAVGFGMEDLTPEEQKLVAELEASYRTAVENQGLKEGIIYLTHGDQVGEIGGYFKDKKGFWYLVEREEKKALEQVPRLQGTSIIWDPNEVRFEYQPQGVPNNWFWRPQQRMVYDPVNRINVAQWNPETNSWNMNPELPPTPEPENWVYIEGVEHVKFAEFNQEQLQMLQEAAALVKQYDPERFALFEKEIDWVILADEGTYRDRKIKTLSGMFWVEEPEGAPYFLALLIWGHEFQHRVQEMNGVDFGVVCRDKKLAEEVEIGKDGAYPAEKELLQKIRQGISDKFQEWADDRLKFLDDTINRIIPVQTCFSGGGS